MGSLDGRVAVVTGAGSGLGRSHALHLAGAGAAVIVNDVGDNAHAVVTEIEAAGGAAFAVLGDTSAAEAAVAMVDGAVEQFGRLDVVVNNAGIVRDRTILNMSDDEWDDVVRVHLRGHFVLTRAAGQHWRAQSKAGAAVAASIINTTSGSGLWGNPGQANYAAAKAGIAGLTLVAARELDRYGVRVNAIAPQARTSMTLASPGFAAVVAAPSDPVAFDYWDPANVSPLVGWLAAGDCPVTGQIYEVHGDLVRVLAPWPEIEHASAGRQRWSNGHLSNALEGWPSAPVPLPLVDG